ncbi:MAG TPA: 23S rRNA (uracil(1939)-C(5))-methyltransferase RlmD [Polyangia bacterium]|jgi:23S rRNA (uracil1939-C5)-methyltransferase
MLELRIDGLDDEGAGVGRDGDVEVHVAFTLPGERVRATLEHKSPHAPRAWARLGEVLAAAPTRRAPLCPAFGRCGGCVLQHAGYGEQLRFKRERVARALAAHPALAGVAVEECAPAPAEVGYRDVAKYVTARLRGRTVAASYAPRSHRPIDMRGCVVPEPEVQGAAEAAVAAAAELGVPPYDERARTGVLRYVVARSNHEGRVLLVVVAAEDFAAADALAALVAERRPAVAGVVLDINRTTGGAILGGTGRTLAGVDHLPERVGAITLELGARTFFQVNRAQAGRLYDLAAELAAPRPDDVVVDLYSGIGGLALTVAPRAGRVIGIEASPDAVAAAGRAAAAAGARCEFRAADATAGLAGVDRADVVILDPPRKGCAAEVPARLLELAPRRIVYVSCDPGSLARDLARLAAGGYHATRVHPVDLFPGTAHVECVALLERDCA